MNIFSIKNEALKTVIAFPGTDINAIDIAKKLIKNSTATLYLYKGVELLAQIR